ncbi:MAG: hypothetical protein FJX65_07180 [Alphaproteobacteria bacterium]|nr:hypothetical protein [Alphaproteobacteria bacterium]
MVQISPGGLPPGGATAPVPAEFPLRRVAAQETRRPIQETSRSDAEGQDGGGANSIIENDRRTDELRARADADERADEERRERRETEEQRGNKVDIRV